MGFNNRPYEGFHPPEVTPLAGITLTDINPSKVIGAGGGRGNVTLVDSNPVGVAAPTEVGIGLLIDSNPSKVVGAGGGKGIKTITDSNPSVTIT